MNRFELTRLPVKVDYSSFISQLSQANYSLGKLDAMFKFVANPNLLVTPLIVKEAALSSRIEGTQSSITDVYLYQAGEITKFEDVKEIVNYRKALEFAQASLKTKPISLNVIRQIHSILMKDVRGYDKARGEFRHIQNWIGVPGTPIERAQYVPPEPIKVLGYMENLEQFINSEYTDCLIQVALVHAQFECIHPFIDGNGRIGRILIPIFLFSKGMIAKPALYISEFFEKNRQTYYQLLNDITKENNYVNWIKFFLEGVAWQSAKTQSTIDKMLGLYNEIKEKLYSYKSPYSFKMLDFIFSQPVFTSKDVITKLDLNKVTVSRLIRIFDKLELLEETERKRNKIYIFRKLLAIIQK